MADPLVAPTIVRYSLNHTFQGRPAVDVLDYSVDELGPFDRHSAIVGTAITILDAWVDGIMSGLSDDLSFDSVSWVDLDSEDGETGSINSTGSNTLPQNGAAGGEPYPASVTFLVTKQTTGGRSTRNGRIYVPGVTEAHTNGNIVDSGYHTTMQGLFDDFLSDTTDTSPLSDWTQQMRVVHTKNVGSPTNPVIEFVSSTDVTALTLDSRVASQRRRNRP